MDFGKTRPRRRAWGRRRLPFHPGVLCTTQRRTACGGLTPPHAWAGAAEAWLSDLYKHWLDQGAPAR